MLVALGLPGGNRSQVDNRFNAATLTRGVEYDFAAGTVEGSTQVGKTQVIDLEAGKPSCQLGRSLLVADALGLRLVDMFIASDPSATIVQDLPDLPDEEVDE